MKRLIIFLFVFGVVLLAIAIVSVSGTKAASYDTGWISPDTVTSAGTGVAFTNPNNVKVTDNAYAQSIINNTNYLTQLLSATNYAFTIPADMEITGIQTRFERKRGTSSLGASINDYQVQVIGCTGTSFSYSGITWPTSDAYQVYGSSSYLWDLSCTPTDINSSSFGFGLRATFQDLSCGSYPCTTRAQVDHMQVKIYYQDKPTIPTSLKAWLLAPFVLGAQAAGCTFTVVDATTTSAWCETATTSAPIINTTQDIGYGLVIFFIMFFGLLYYFRKK